MSIQWFDATGAPADDQTPALLAALPRVDASRGNDPFVVSIPLIYVSAVSYSSNRRHLFLMHTTGGFPFFQGTTAIRDEQYFDMAAFEQTAARALWTLDGDGWLGRVPAPNSWRLLREEPASDGYAQLTVRLYVPP